MTFVEELSLELRRAQERERVHNARLRNIRNDERVEVELVRQANREGEALKLIIQMVREGR